MADAQSPDDSVAVATAMAKAVTAIAEPRVIRVVDTSTPFGRLLASALRDHAMDSTGMSLSVRTITIAGDSAELRVRWMTPCRPGHVHADRMRYAFVRSSGEWHLVSARLEAMESLVCSR